MSIQINYHSSIRIEDKAVMYFDPWKIEGEPHDADIIFVTHTHYDHFSPDDIVLIHDDIRRNVVSEMLLTCFGTEPVQTYISVLVRLMDALCNVGYGSP